MSATAKAAAQPFAPSQFDPSPNNLESFWMPFTANRQFKSKPRLFVGAEGMHYTTIDNRKVLDGTAGLWCCNAGHGRKKISEAVAKQIQQMDYAPAFQMGHPCAFELASRLTHLVPGDLDHVFFTNSGSESVDTALKIALAYHRVKGQGQRTRLIGRERGYHGVGFGGISVGGIVSNRKFFGPMLAGVDHLPHTHNLEKNAFSKGQPEWGAHLADELERIVTLHDASTIAAVIVEPVAGSTGVLIPPKGYLQKLRQICDKHGILLIFDEVITGFGRLGSPFGAEHFGVQPDMITCAKGLTNGAVPMGAVFARKHIYDAFMDKLGGERDRAVPRLHLLRPSGGVRGGPRRARHLQGGRPVRELRQPCQILGRRGAFAEGHQERHRPAQHGPDRGHRAGADPGQADGAGVQRVPQGVRQGPADPHHRRHHRAVAAADRGKEPHRPDLQHAR